VLSYHVEEKGCFSTSSELAEQINDFKDESVHVEMHEESIHKETVQESFLGHQRIESESKEAKPEFDSSVHRADEHIQGYQQEEQDGQVASIWVCIERF
jgi:predicted  nucleic acid-binding Zn-ribbon protein